MKAIIIGTSLSGKTTLIRYLRSHTQLPLLEIDEELVRVNNGEYPNIVFFTNTDYFSVESLTEARAKGFKIIQLNLDADKMRERNESRIKNEGYDDLSQYFEGMVKYQAEIREKHLVDTVIDAEKPVEAIAEELLTMELN